MRYFLKITDAHGNVVHESHFDSVPEPEPPPIPSPNYNGVVIADTLNVRTSPELSNNVVTQLTKGTELVVERSVNDNVYQWLRIAHGQYEGRYVAERQLATGLHYVKADFGYSKFLTVPYESQLDYESQAANDCGQACVSMLLQYHCNINKTPDQISSVISGRTSAYQLRDLMNHFGCSQYAVLDSYTRANVIDLIKTRINEKRPKVLLVNYEKLALVQHVYGYVGLHWLLAVGYGEDFILVHDPLWLTTSNNGQGGQGGRFIRIYNSNLIAAIDEDYSLG